MQTLCSCTTTSREAIESATVDLGRGGHQLRWLVALYDRDYEAMHRTLDAMPSDELELQYRILNRASLRGLAYQLAGQAELAIPQFENARTQTEASLQARPEDYRLYISLGEALVGLGEREAAIRAAERALEILPLSLDAYAGRFVQMQAIKSVLVPAAANDRALELLDEYLSVPGGGYSIEGLLPDPRLDSIRNEPRFVTLVEKYKRQ
jgi:tetratricopeptide (TPR) repeat protein